EMERSGNLYMGEEASTVFSFVKGPDLGNVMVDSMSVGTGIGSMV
ncbi:hypothetical protein KIPB_011985, partial [Kipferlia bialata]